ncbi:biofilm master transcriptional regulator CsgD [Ewingella americana]|jgi:LuxR family transcriptional regulator of csgAB operon|uniref:Transcriptional regulator CsgD n=1 Tax=Ewingella americana TaxID=41202 RepID=A0A502GPX8_9GAMM|nr:biofilm master transcriptional regulator CsgD [Ewingella americana]TPG63330.1 transcriptional regulator CsgD [Ewingella americana]
MNNGANINNNLLLLVTRPSLQASALLQQLKHQLCVNTKLHNINKSLDNIPLDETPLTQALILFDMMEADRRQIVLWQSVLSRFHENIKLLLFNTPNDYHFREIETWPRISAVFYISTDENKLVEGINSVIHGECYFTQGFASYLISQSGQYRYLNYEESGLTHREKEILNKLRVGASNTEIARLLFISENTVKTHLYNLFRKISVKNRTQAVSWANDNLKC